MVGDLQTAAAILSWSLCAAFLFAGWHKLKRPELAALALIDFGLVRHHRSWLGLVAGLVEIAIGVAAPIVLLAPWNTGAAALLLWVFAAFLTRAVRRGADFPCFCFGESDAAVSKVTVARTIALALLATAVTAVTAVRGAAALAGEEQVLAAIAGLAFAGSALLATRLPALLRLNRDFMQAGGAHV